MRNRIAIVSILAGLMGAGWVSGQVKPAGTSVSAEERIRWFRQDKLGMFIHWGPYSLLAG